MMIDEKLIVDLTILGFFIFVCIAAGVSRYENKLQFLKDVLLGFAIGSSCYLLLNYWFEDTKTKVGITGIIILCSKPLYDWANTFIRDWLTKLIMRKKKTETEEIDNAINENNNDNEHS